MDTNRIEELKALVRTGQIRFLTLDTSAFKNNGLALDRGLLGQLSQFRTNRFDLVLSEVVVKEVRRHIAQLIESDLAGWPKLLRRLKSIPYCAEMAEELDNDLRELDSKARADHEFDQFLISTGADVVSADHAKLDEVLDLYFNGEAPFGTNGKRNEFPDAIALLGLEAWCKPNSGMIVVSTDNDWVRFCEQSKTGNLYLVNDLAVALDIINSSALERAELVKARQRFLLDRLYSAEVRYEVEHQLRKQLAERARPVGRSSLDYVAEVVKVETSPLTFGKVSRIRDDIVSLSVIIEIEAHCTFWSQFTFYDLDGEEKTRQIGKGVYGHGQTISAGAMLNVKGEDFSIEAIVNPEKLRIDYGRVEPDEGGIQSHAP